MERIQKLLNEKEILLSEVNHRVKNNLTTLIRILSLNSTKEYDQSAKEVFSDAENRLRTMIGIYDRKQEKGSTILLEPKTI